MLDQLALADFLDRGKLDRHLRRTRGVYVTPEVAELAAALRGQRRR